MPPILIMDDVVHRYGDTDPVLVDCSLEIDRGEIVSLLGPSGCGKTTALRVVAGFERVISGSVTIDGARVSDEKAHLPPEDRRIGMVFQDAALFPHLTIAKNIGFGLHRMAARDRVDRIEALLALIGLEGTGGRYPHELSGGQQQRVALARAMAPNPKLILLDEPFANLDADLREKLSRDLRHVLEQSGATALLVTHDQREAFVMADRIALMNRGKIIQIGSARDLYERPADLFAARFVGKGTLIRGLIREDGRAETALGHLEVAGSGLLPDTVVQILIRPEQLTLRADGVNAIVQDRMYLGSDSLTTVELEDGTRLITKLATTRDRVEVSIVDPSHPVRAWPVDPSEERLDCSSEQQTP